MWEFRLEKSKDYEESGSQATEYGTNKPYLVTPKYEISTLFDDALSEHVSNSH